MANGKQKNLIVNRLCRSLSSEVTVDPTHVDFCSQTQKSLNRKSGIDFVGFWNQDQKIMEPR